MDMSELSRLLQACSPEVRAGVDQAIRRGLSPLRVPPPMRASQWAEKHFYLSAESSYVEGRWVCYPFQRAILDCIGHDEIEVIDLRKSARVGYTKMILAGIGYFAEHKRRNQVLYQPTDDDRDEFVTTELDPMLRDVRIMRSIFPKMSSRSKDNTMRLKMFLTGALHLRGGKAGKNYRRLTVDVVWYDELDGFDRDIEREGSPTKLGDKRLEGSTFPKSVRGTTPKTKHASHIEDCEASADLRFHFHVPCVHCDELHTLEWGSKQRKHGFKWSDNDPETVVHMCPHCGIGETQGDYLQVWTRGRWIAENGTWIDDECRFITAAGVQMVKPPRHVAFHIWTGYSKQATWPGIVRDFIAANERAKRGDFSELKTFINTTLGETYEERSEAADEHELLRRAKAETPRYDLGTVPVGCLVLVAGVDVQDNRFEVVVWGFGRGEEAWVIDVQVLTANPADERDWARLDDYLQTRFRQVYNGGTLGIEAVAIDTGGHFTHQVYNFVRAREHRRIVGVRGSNRYGGPIKGTGHKQDVNWRGQVIKAGVKVFEVGTDTAKDLIYGRTRVMHPGPGYMHFSHQLTADFFNQLTAEGRMVQKTSTGEQYRWVKLRTRNEALDCTVYALFAAHLLDLHRYTEKMWQRLEAAVQPPPDLFSVVPPEEQGAHREAEQSRAAEVTHELAPPPAERARAVATSQGREW
jgi:phage terminase large subunit GpA-like protein